MTARNATLPPARIADDPEALAAIMLLKSRGYTSEQVSLYMRCVVREVKPDVI